MYLCDTIIGDHSFGEEKHTACLRYACVLYHQGHGPFSHLFEKMFIPELLHGKERKEQEELLHGKEHEKQEELLRGTEWEVSIMVVVC